MNAVLTLLNKVQRARSSFKFPSLVRVVRKALVCSSKHLPVFAFSTCNFACMSLAYCVDYACIISIVFSPHLYSSLVSESCLKWFL